LQSEEIIVPAGDLNSIKPGGVCPRAVLLVGVVLFAVLGLIGVLFLLDRSGSGDVAVSDPRPLSAVELADLRSRAEKGAAAAQNQMGELYLYGRGIRPDSKVAAGWFEKSAAQGYAAAQLNLGMLFDAGQGVPMDYARAVEWFRKAAGQGLSAAQYNLAAMFAYGRGVGRDEREAVRWLTLAAGQGYGLAEFGLGHRYIAGTGVPVDLVEAFKWLKLAEAAKISGAADALDEIKEKMSGAEIAEGLKRARQFVPKIAEASGTK
jgi:uncharacterized protein